MNEPKQFSANIVKRALGDSDYAAFLERYNSASLRGHRAKAEWQPTIEDSFLYARWVKGESLLVLARESGLTRNELSRRFAYLTRAAGVEHVEFAAKMTTNELPPDVEFTPGEEPVEVTSI